MPTTKRRIDPGLIERLRNEPYRFEFFQAVRLLLTEYRRDSRAQSQDALGQAIRFRSSISLAFPPSEIEALEFDWNDEQPAAEHERQRFEGVTLTPSFIGLTGPSGALPRHYTQQVAEREIYHRDTATRAFLDIFTTRAVALFYQSWLRSRLHLQYECDRKNKFLPLILSFAGLGSHGVRDRLAGAAKGITDESLAYYAGALRERPQSAHRFSQVVAEYFQVPCEVEQFVGQWFELPAGERTRLGMANSSLGRTALCGARVWNRQSKVRVILGPLRRHCFNAFLPGGEAADNLKRFFHLMVGVTFDCEVRLVLDKRDAGNVVLGGQYGAEGVRLGWNGWLRTRTNEADSEDAAYLITAGHGA